MAPDLGMVASGVTPVSGMVGSGVTLSGVIASGVAPVSGAAASGVAPVSGAATSGALSGVNVSGVLGPVSPLSRGCFWCVPCFWHGRF